MGLLFVGGDFGQDVGAVDVGIDLLPVLDDLAGGRDEEGLALGELHVSVGHDGNTVGVDDLVVGVSQELEAEGILGAPRLVAFDGVEADAEYDRVQGVVLGHVTLEVVGLDGAACRLVLGVEVEDDPLAFVVAEADGLIFLRGQGEVGCGGPNLHCVCCCSGIGPDAEAAGCYYCDDCCDPNCFAHGVFLFG
jgi:hypothetical protein